MDVFFISRGMNEQVDKWKKYMETWMMPLPYKQNGEEKNIWYQGNLKPIQLWSYTFPRAQKDFVLSTLAFADKTSNIGWLNKYTYPLRKLLKCEPIGEFKKVDPRYVAKEFVQLLPIGIREDLQDKEFPDGVTREFV